VVGKQKTLAIADVWGDDGLRLGSLGSWRSRDEDSIDCDGNTRLQGVIH